MVWAGARENFGTNLVFVDLTLNTQNYFEIPQSDIVPFMEEYHPDVCAIQHNKASPHTAFACN